MRTQIRALLLIGIVLPRLAQGQENSWTNINSGKWETNSNVSLGVAPSITQSFTSITNAPSKTVAIDAVTTNLPGTLTISNLTLFAPLGSAHSLFLNNPGTNTPLRVLRSLFVNARSTLLLFSNSVVEVSAAGLGDSMSVSGDGFVNLLDGGTLIVTNFAAATSIGVAGNNVLAVNNGTLRNFNFTAGELGVGTLTIPGGLVEVHAALTLAIAGSSTGVVWVTGGQLVATNGLTSVGDGDVGRLTLSTGIVHA